jgi:hypothetical protein
MLSMMALVTGVVAVGVRFRDSGKRQASGYGGSSQLQQSAPWKVHI